MSISRVRRMAVAGTAGIAAAIVLVAGVAWACTGQPRVVLQPPTGPPGAVVNVYGNSFGAGPVSVRWGSPAGTELAKADGPSFSVNVRIPSVPPGSYTIIAVQKTVTGSTSTAPASFKVTQPTSTGSTPSTDTGGSTPSTDTGGANTNTDTGGANTGGNAEAETSTGDTTTNWPRSEGPSPAPNAATGEPATTAGGPAPASARSTEPSAAPGTAAAGVRGAVAPGERRSAGPVAAPAATGPADVGAPPAREFSPRAASGDLWSGFAPGRSLGRGAGLLETPASTDGSSRLALGLALVVGSMTAMGAGFLYADTRRRRVLATAPADRSSGY